MRPRTKILFCAMVACVLMPSGPAGAEIIETRRSGRLYFGFAETSITPDRPVALGGQYHTRISSEVHDPLSATAMAIETRDQEGIIDQAVFVSCDLSIIRKNFQEDVRRRVGRRVAELDVRKIVISATHAHTAPALTDADEKDLHPYDLGVTGVPPCSKALWYRVLR